MLCFSLSKHSCHPLCRTLSDQQQSSHCEPRQVSMDVKHDDGASDLAPDSVLPPGAQARAAPSPRELRGCPSPPPSPQSCWGQMPHNGAGPGHTKPFPIHSGKQAGRREIPSQLERQWVLDDLSMGSAVRTPEGGRREEEGRGLSLEDERDLQQMMGRHSGV